MAVNWIGVTTAMFGLLGVLGGLFAFVNAIKNQAAVVEQRVTANEKRLDKCENSSERFRNSVAEEFKESRRETNVVISKLSDEVGSLRDIIITHFSQKKD